MPGELKDINKAEGYLLQGAVLPHNNSKCYEELANIHESDNLLRSYHWLLMSAKENQNSEEMFKIGLVYKKGLLFPKNYKKAFLWFDLARKFGSKSSEIFIAFFYEKGMYVKKDLDLAIKCILNILKVRLFHKE